MDFDLSKPQRLLKQSARELLSRECKAERVRQVMANEDAYDEALWRSIADQGWTGLGVPEAQGGLALGVVELAAVFEETGRVCMPGPFLSTTFAAALIARMGTAEQQTRYLEPIATGERKATVAILEQSASWDLDSIELSAALHHEVFVLSGEKHFVQDAAVADTIFCVARAGSELLVLPVEKESAGLSIRRTPSMDETRKSSVVTFDGVRVHHRNALPGDRASLQAAIDLATVALCAEMVGGMQWVLDTTVEYAKARQQFGRPIGSFQAVQHQCADMLLMTESSRSATYYAAWALTHDHPSASLAVSIAKAYCSDAYREVSNRGAQVHGGIGFTWEHDLQLYYKRSKASETLFGDATLHRERIAKLVVDDSPGRLEAAALAATAAGAR
ncbi:MAG: acyl-CoA dehydrogenase family protein [Acidobacteriota bacterium]